MSNAVKVQECTRENGKLKKKRSKTFSCFSEAFDEIVDPSTGCGAIVYTATFDSNESGELPLPEAKKLLEEAFSLDESYRMTFNKDYFVFSINDDNLECDVEDNVWFIFEKESNMKKTTKTKKAASNTLPTKNLPPLKGGDSVTPNPTLYPIAASEFKSHFKLGCSYKIKTVALGVYLMFEGINFAVPSEMFIRGEEE